MVTRASASTAFGIAKKPSPGSSLMSGTNGSPPATVQATPAPAANATYTVQAGDTLYSIALKFNTTIQALQQANNITNPNALAVGQTLSIPGAPVAQNAATPAPTARGRSVGPVMLEHLAAVLRERDVFRAWALIGSDNPASVRAFQKASFTPVCDVIRARMVNVDRLIVRPPDPEARDLLGM